jgi:hypothetical protein
VADIGFSLLQPFFEGWHRSIFLSIGKIEARGARRHPAHCAGTPVHSLCSASVSAAQRINAHCRLTGTLPYPEA